MNFFVLLASLFFTTAILAQEKPEGLFINSKAPDIKAKDQNGADINTKDLRKKGPVVILFYRGHWCPYCNKELKRFQDSLSFLTAKGASLIAITPEATDGIKRTIEKTGATFPIIFDKDMKLAKAYSVSFTVDEKTASRYKSFGADLLQINQQKGQPNLPVPAVYIINKDGSVIYRYFDSDYKKRPSVADLLKQL